MAKNCPNIEHDAGIMSAKANPRSNMMMSVKKSLYQLNLAIVSTVPRKLRTLQRWQGLGKRQTVALQQKRLRQLLLHAYNHVPYYRKVLNSSGVVSASGAINLEFFGQISLLDKATIRTQFEGLMSNDLATRKWYHNASGGSTGEPVRLIQDKDHSDWIRAIKMLYDLWTGYTLSAGRIRLWGSMRDLSNTTQTFSKRYNRWLMNELWLNAFRMTPEQMRDYVRQINSFKPVQILAYVESIYELSLLIEREGLPIHSPRAIMTSAGTLHSHMRKTIERVFKAPVFNRYGSREMGDIACECHQHSGLHVSAPTHYLEILKPDGSHARPGEVGEIVVTLLTNYSMPLIRYRIGDLGSWADKPCHCGRTWPVLEEVTGRVTDVFRKRDGTVVSPEYLIHLVGVVLNSGWILKYQVIQDDYEQIRILLITNGTTNKPHLMYHNEMETISKKIRLVMGEGCRVEYQFVDDIPPTASGKYRYTISKVAP